MGPVLFSLARYSGIIDVVAVDGSAIGGCRDILGEPLNQCRIVFFCSAGNPGSFFLLITFDLLFSRKEMVEGSL
jgi:hypothetical protein